MMGVMVVMFVIMIMRMNMAMLNPRGKVFKQLLKKKTYSSSC